MHTQHTTKEGTTKQGKQEKQAHHSGKALPSNQGREVVHVASLVEVLVLGSIVGVLVPKQETGGVVAVKAVVDV